MQLDREAPCVAGEPFGGLGADRPGAFEQRRRVVAEVHDQRRRAAPDRAAAAVLGECHERVGGRLLPVQDRAGLLVSRPLLLGDVPDRLFEDGALFERQPAAQTQLAPPTRPTHAQRASLVERLVVLDLLRRERPRGERDHARRFSDRDTRKLAITLRRRELRSSRDLIERQRARAQRVVERRQAAKRRTRLRDPHGGAVIATGDVREPLRTRRAPRRPPIRIIVGVAHELRDPLGKPRLLRKDRHQLAPTPLTTQLERLINHPIHCHEHTFETTTTQPPTCRHCAEIQRRVSGERMSTVTRSATTTPRWADWCAAIVFSAARTEASSFVNSKAEPAVTATPPTTRLAAPNQRDTVRSSIAWTSRDNLRTCSASRRPRPATRGLVPASREPHRKRGQLTITIDGERLDPVPGQTISAHGPDRNLSVDEVGCIQFTDAGSA